jgi:hypothetical protein
MKINLRKRIEPMSLKYNLSDLPTGSESRQSHVEFIRVNLELMLAVAWNGYESEGRGAIVIDVSLSKTSQIGINPYQRWLNSESYGSYLSLTTVKRIATESGYPNPFQGEEKRQINEYKPEKQVVVCFIRSDGGFSSYIYLLQKAVAVQTYPKSLCHRQFEFGIWTRLNLNKDRF